MSRVSAPRLGASAPSGTRTELKLLLRQRSIARRSAGLPSWTQIRSRDLVPEQLSWIASRRCLTCVIESLGSCGLVQPDTRRDRPDEDGARQREQDGTDK